MELLISDWETRKRVAEEAGFWAVDQEMLENNPLGREALEKAAEALTGIGLRGTAAIVKYAAEALPEAELYCPYAEDDTCNCNSWQASYQRRRRFGPI